jgi:hypothetical protein
MFGLPWFGGKSAAAESPKNTVKLRRVSRGGTGTIINQGFISDLEHNADLRGAKWYGEPGKLGIAGKMVREPHVRASVSYIADGLAEAKWRFKAASKEPRDIECADYLAWAFTEQLPIEQIIHRIVRGYMPHGVSLHEVLDDQVTLPSSRFPLHPGNGIGLVPTAFEERPAWTIYQWIPSKKRSSQLAGVRQRLIQSDVEKDGTPYIPADRLLRLTWDKEGGDFTGLAPLRSAYGPWKLKNALMNIDAIKHERTGVGTPSITLGEKADEEDIAAAEIVLAQMRANAKGFLVLPYGWTFEWNGAGENEASNINLAIQRCNVAIAFNVISGHMLLGLTAGSGGGGGSFALSNTQVGGQHLHISRHAKTVMAAFNHGQDGFSIVKRIAQANYGANIGVPILQARALPTRNWQKIVDTINKSVLAGVITPDAKLEEDVREYLEVGPHDPSTARRAPSFGASDGDGDGEEIET